jgi:protein transport protein SEC61 subunit gamma and related proteins
MSDVNSILLEPLAEFYRDSKYLVMQCNKPDREEFAKVARATGVGFLIMGFIGFFVKVIHIPINNILIGGM